MSPLQEDARAQSPPFALLQPVPHCLSRVSHLSQPFSRAVLATPEQGLEQASHKDSCQVPDGHQEHLQEEPLAPLPKEEQAPQPTRSPAKPLPSGAGLPRAGSTSGAGGEGPLSIHSLLPLQKNPPCWLVDAVVSTEHTMREENSSHRHSHALPLPFVQL